MAVQTEDSNDFDFVKGYAECVSQAANSWAYLEYYMNECIWALADAAPALGACITSQVVNLNARMNALLALMKLRGLDNKLISRANKLADNARGPNEMRNRIVHDMWFLDREEPNAMGQLTVTASKKLTFTIKTTALSEVEAQVRTIIKVRNEAMRLRDEIFAAIPSLPEIPHATLHPITQSRGDQ